MIKSEICLENQKGEVKLTIMKSMKNYLITIIAFLHNSPLY